MSSGKTDLYQPAIIMTQAKTGDLLWYHYLYRLDKGTEYGTSRSGDPFELVIGSGDSPWGFEACMIDLAVGETMIVVVSPHEALGPHRADLLETIDRSEIAGGAGLESGSMVQTMGLDVSSISATIANSTSDSVTLDTNRSLAGKQVNFETEFFGTITARPGVKPHPKGNQMRFGARLRLEAGRTSCQRWAPYDG